MVSRTMSHRASRMLYVGNLPGDIREREVEDLFYKYGHIVEIDLKIPPRPPGYAFVEFEDYRDAEDAIRGRDGYDFDGHRLRVEYAHGGRGSSSVDRYSSYRGSSGHVLVTGLPSSASWQDLKDHMRRAGDVCFSQVFRDRDGMRGIVDYTSYDDMRYAIRKLDDSLFRNQFDRAYIRVGKEGFLNSLEILLWNVIQDVATQGVPVIQEAEVPVAAIAIVAGVEATLQGSNILMGLNIDLVRGLFHHSPVLSYLLTLCQGMLFFSLSISSLYVKIQRLAVIWNCVSGAWWDMVLKLLQLIWLWRSRWISRSPPQSPPRKKRVSTSSKRGPSRSRSRSISPSISPSPPRKKRVSTSSKRDPSRSRSRSISHSISPSPPRKKRVSTSSKRGPSRSQSRSISRSISPSVFLFSFQILLVWFFFFPCYVLVEAELVRLSSLSRECLKVRQFCFQQTLLVLV
ncbi:hypothetical protein RHMOL_Rhmol07G0247400 [Rhododendron molle]|uniref:Uncharacterized protein n=1 Tax=Rhododendron molle TaxID=49168 RepID=A0ACC0N4T2_RHOML|nr:hypothetical protein RHMOL_Rhmol07G0247400 [Rhododendron molle]